eukprot:TRINITY_DN1965_c0_g1_i1.p2 TRINITY_DN1965_c0_g1~~TRINITY_DN1965_c0_g1_i1.p2  ORF type:complete len:121 (-),score=3.81 TRINITY_DN1965_c0_g1_i1:41-403(-)
MCWATGPGTKSPLACRSLVSSLEAFQLFLCPFFPSFLPLPHIYYPHYLPFFTQFYTNFFLGFAPLQRPSLGMMAFTLLYYCPIRHSPLPHPNTSDSTSCFAFPRLAIFIVAFLSPPPIPR